MRRKRYAYDYPSPDAVRILGWIFVGLAVLFIAIVALSFL